MFLWQTLTLLQSWISSRKVTPVSLYTLFLGPFVNPVYQVSRFGGANHLIKRKRLKWDFMTSLNISVFFSASKIKDILFSTPNFYIVFLLMFLIFTSNSSILSIITQIIFSLQLFSDEYRFIILTTVSETHVMSFFHT